MAVKTGVIGATGYAGAELVRILSGHPQAELAAISSVSFQGQPLSAVYPAYYGLCDMVCGTEDEVLQKTMGERVGRESHRSRYAPEPQRKAEAVAEWKDEPEAQAPRIGRPPAQEGPKVAVTLYLTEPVAHLLEEVRFRLLTEYGVRTSKSAIADFAMRRGLGDLDAAAEDLRRD